VLEKIITIIIILIIICRYHYYGHNRYSRRSPVAAAYDKCHKHNIFVSLPINKPLRCKSSNNDLYIILLNAITNHDDGHGIIVGARYSVRTSSSSSSSSSPNAQYVYYGRRGEPKKKLTQTGASLYLPPRL